MSVRSSRTCCPRGEADDLELKLVNGDYVPDGLGGLSRLTGVEAVAARVLYRLAARRGGLPFLPGLGSRLHLVLRERPSVWQDLCARYVAEALEEEPDLKVTGVELTPRGERADLTVRLEGQGEPLTVTMEL